MRTVFNWYLIPILMENRWRYFYHSYFQAFRNIKCFTVSSNPISVIYRD